MLSDFIVGMLSCSLPRIARWSAPTKRDARDCSTFAKASAKIGDADPGAAANIVKDSPVKRIAAFCVLTAYVLAATPGQTQFAGMFQDTGLSGEDADLAGRTAATLYQGRMPRTGDEAAWKSDRTTSEGSVRVIEVDEQNACIVLAHRIRASASARYQTLRFRRCRDAAGNWVLSPV
jgi:hypothetical protein